MLSGNLSTQTINHIKSVIVFHIFIYRRLKAIRRYSLNQDIHCNIPKFTTHTQPGFADSNRQVPKATNLNIYTSANPNKKSKPPWIKTPLVLFWDVYFLRLAWHWVGKVLNISYKAHIVMCLTHSIQLADKSVIWSCARYWFWLCFMGFQYALFTAFLKRLITQTNVYGQPSTKLIQ